MGWVVNEIFRPIYLQERDPVPIYRRLGGPQGLCGRVRKISPLTELEHWAVQPVPSHMYLRTYITLKNSFSHRISVIL